MIPPRIAVTPAQIDAVVARFYARVRADVALAPIFARHVTDWPAHEAKIAGFWRNALLHDRSYDGNPMQAHLATGTVKSAHFAPWLALFDATLEAELPPALSAPWSALVHRIGRGLRSGLLSANAVPNLR